MSSTPFDTRTIANAPRVTAPDGSDVRVLLSVPGGSMAQFELPPGRVSLAVTHRTVDEIWYVVGGRGQMWRKQGEREETITLEPGVCLTIPLGTHFQFRADESESLTAIGITLPPWPGADEACGVPGPWSTN